jgi:hypothetical protein
MIRSGYFPSARPVHSRVILVIWSRHHVVMVAREGGGGNSLSDGTINVQFYEVAISLHQIEMLNMEKYDV